MTRKILKTLIPVFLAAGAWLLLSMQAHAGDYTALGCPLAIDAGPLRCEAGADRDTRMRDRLAQLQAEGRLKPMPRPRSQPAPLAKSASRLMREGHPRPEDPEAGLVPADYINPIDLVREQGHLRHEVHVDIPRDWGSRHSRLVQALSFQAPDWARKMLVEFIPDEPLDKQGPAGLYLRPHNPFVEGSFPQTEGPFDRYPIDVHAINQAAYRSENIGQYGIRHYILVTRDMDPAPAGKSWHVAIGQLQSWSISGTVRVYFSGSTYRPPLAVRLYYDAEEEAQQVGFFDPTPREPDGDNPGQESTPDDEFIQEESSI
ncbi:MAG TPA: hypothetical protein VK972_09155 [Wenzhouxiangella sp.]|nr:hypothetical protein [Wenzhouxiangella sp.]